MNKIKCPICKSKHIKIFLDGTCFCFNCEDYFDFKTRKGITNPKYKDK